MYIGSIYIGIIIVFSTIGIRVLHRTPQDSQGKQCDMGDCGLTNQIGTLHPVSYLATY